MRLLVICSDAMSAAEAQSIVTNALHLEAGIAHTWKVRFSPDRILGLISNFEPKLVALIYPSPLDIARVLEIKSLIPKQTFNTVFIGLDCSDEYVSEVDFEDEEIGAPIKRATRYD